MLRVTLVVATLMSLCVPAISDTVTVTQTVTYKDNCAFSDANGPFFIPREVILDHDYRRGAWQDWGWTHDMSSLVPAGATGIASATLKIRAWDVADANVDGVIYPEQDRIYAVRTSVNTPVDFKTSDYEGMGDTPLRLSATELGDLAQTGTYKFGSTTFTITDEGILADLWSNQALSIFMNIDTAGALYGHQVTLVYASLTVDYVVPDATWTPSLPVYRFWSPTLGLHFYTTNEAEKTKLTTVQRFMDNWDYENIAYYTYPDNRQNDANSNPVVKPVYRFWSTVTGAHFFTISESEKDKLMAWCSDADAKSVGISATWAFEGIAFYAHVEGDQPAGASPIYRFWSGTLHHHFFTVTESEKTKLVNLPSIWTPEGTAWYAYAP